MSINGVILSVLLKVHATFNVSLATLFTRQLDNRALYRAFFLLESTGVDPWANRE